MECTFASLSLTVLKAKGKALMARPAIVPKKTTRGFALLKSLDLGIIELMMNDELIDNSRCSRPAISSIALLGWLGFQPHTAR